MAQAIWWRRLASDARWRDLFPNGEVDKRAVLQQPDARLKRMMHCLFPDELSEFKQDIQRVQITLAMRVKASAVGLDPERERERLLRLIGEVEHERRCA